MTERTAERLGALAGLVASLSVGVPVLAEQLNGGGGLFVGPAWAWWLAYGVYLAAFAGCDWVPPRVPWLGPRRLLAVQAVAAAAAVALVPPFGWTSVLLVVTAVTAAFVLSARATALLVAWHVTLVAAVMTAHGIATAEVLIGALAYGSLQAFAVLMVYSSRREAEARARLADAHAELRATTALLAESSRSAERLRIARDLHDLVGHQLTALTLQLEVAAHRATPPASEHVDRARGLAKELLTDVRAAVGDLRAPTPPLRGALEALTADLPRPRVHVQVADAVEIDAERTTALVRCVQEITTNAARHADADNLWIDIAAGADGEVVLRAHDDGRGAESLQVGNGLTGLRERVEQLGGVVSFDPARGFRVVAEVPAR